MVPTVQSQAMYVGDHIYADTLLGGMPLWIAWTLGGAFVRTGPHKQLSILSTVISYSMLLGYPRIAEYGKES